MSTQISFSLHFSADASANDLLLKHLSAGFSSFLCPKMGRIKADGMLLEFGPRPFGKLYEQNTLLEGEEVVAPDITALSQYPNATDEIVQFLTRLLGPTRFNAELVGDCRIDYPDGTNVVEG
jgi:hypothetical protein